MSDFVGCSNYYNCQNIQDSQYIVNSNGVDFSSFVHDSTAVSHSTDVYKSDDVTNSLRVFESQFVYSSEDITASNFCVDSKKLKNCLFCHELEGKEYYIFNKPVDKERFEVVLKQYQRIMGGLELDYMREPWPESMLIPSMPSPFSYFNKHYLQLPDKFWKWVQTVPGYDALKNCSSFFCASLTINKEIKI